MISIKQIAGAVLICLGLTLFSFCLHILPSTNTMVNYVDANHPKDDKLIVTDGFLPWAVDYHDTLLEFKKRKITTFFIKNTSELLGLRISIAFVLVNFLFTFLSGLLIYYLGRLYQLSHQQALISAALFYTSFSILLAYFIPIATYDEPIQYFFIILSLIFLKKNKKILFLIFFTISVLVRESSLILLIGIYLMEFDFKNRLITKSNIIGIILFSFPVVIYIIYLLWFYYSFPEFINEAKYVSSKRFTLYEKNFRDSENISRTILSLFSSILLSGFIIMFYQIKNKLSIIEKKIFLSFYLVFIVNIVIVFLAVFAEESRVFFIPFLIVLPIMGKFLDSILQLNKPFMKYLFNVKRILIMVIVVVCSWVLFKIGYQLTNFKPHENLHLYVEYNTLTIFFLLLIVFYQEFISKTKLPQQENS